MAISLNITTSKHEVMICNAGIKVLYRAERKNHRAESKSDIEPQLYHVYTLYHKMFHGLTMGEW